MRSSAAGQAGVVTGVHRERLTQLVADLEGRVEGAGGVLRHVGDAAPAQAPQLLLAHA